MEEKSKTRSKIYDIVPYVYPNRFDRPKNNNNNTLTQIYSLNKKSDVYSIGVLLWEISSGRVHFYSETDDDNFDIGLAVQISQGHRENPIPGTPLDYVKLYTGN